MRIDGNICLCYTGIVILIGFGKEEDVIYVF